MGSTCRPDSRTTRKCTLLIIGATPAGKNEFVGFTGGKRESAHDWRALLLDLKRRGLAAPPRGVALSLVTSVGRCALEVVQDTVARPCTARAAGSFVIAGAPTWGAGAGRASVP